MSESILQSGEKRFPCVLPVPQVPRKAWSLVRALPPLEGLLASPPTPPPPPARPPELAVHISYPQDTGCPTERCRDSPAYPSGFISSPPLSLMLPRHPACHPPPVLIHRRLPLPLCSPLMSIAGLTSSRKPSEALLLSAPWTVNQRPDICD